MSFSAWILKESILAIQLKKGKDKLIKRKSEVHAPGMIKKHYIVEEFKIKGRKTFKIFAESGNDCAILFLHGGAYLKGFAMPHWALLAKLLKRLTVDIFAPDYPLVPNTYKDAFNMLSELYNKLLKEYGSENIIIMGDSAGAGLSLGFCMYLRDNNIEQPKKNVMIAPWLDLSMKNPEIADYDRKDPWLNVKNLKKNGKIFAGKEGTSNPYCSPIYGDPEGLSDMLMIFGTYDVLCPDGIKFNEICKSKDVKLDFFLKEKMIHTYPMMPVKEAEEAREKIIDFIHK